MSVIGYYFIRAVEFFDKTRLQHAVSNRRIFYHNTPTCFQSLLTARKCTGLAGKTFSFRSLTISSTPPFAAFSSDGPQLPLTLASTAPPIAPD